MGVTSTRGTSFAPASFSCYDSPRGPMLSVHSLTRHQVIPCKGNDWLLSQTFPEVIGGVTSTRHVTSAISFLPRKWCRRTRPINCMAFLLEVWVMVSVIYTLDQLCLFCNVFLLFYKFKFHTFYRLRERLCVHEEIVLRTLACIAWWEISVAHGSFRSLRSWHTLKRSLKCSVIEECV